MEVAVNYFVVLVKYFIYKCRLSGSQPTLIGLKNMLKQVYEIEKLSATQGQASTGNKIELKWAIIKDIL